MYCNHGQKWGTVSGNETRAQNLVASGVIYYKFPNKIMYFYKELHNLSTADFYEKGTCRVKRNIASKELFAIERRGGSRGWPPWLKPRSDFPN